MQSSASWFSVLYVRLVASSSPPHRKSSSSSSVKFTPASRSSFSPNLAPTSSLTLFPNILFLPHSENNASVLLNSACCWGSGEASKHSPYTTWAYCWRMLREVLHFVASDMQCNSSFKVKLEACSNFKWTLCWAS